VAVANHLISGRSQATPGWAVSIVRDSRGRGTRAVISHVQREGCGCGSQLQLTTSQA